MTDDKKPLNTCGCCTVPEGPGPHLIENRPGLSALAYRVGTHGQFKAAMKNALSGSRALDGLTVREDNDFSISLLDAWAVTADVLSFYQERIANEGYLRTAGERLSLLHLARLIGYQLNPGVAADTYLAFTLMDKPEPPPPVTIDTGAKVQSVPGPGEKAQTFETLEDIEARAEWNAIKPRLTQPQELSAGMGSIILNGTATDLKAGDTVMILLGSAKTPRKILQVTVDNDAKKTRIDFDSPSPPPPSYVRPSLPNGSLNLLQDEEELNEIAVQTIMNKSWKEEDLSALLKLKNWSAQELAANIAEQVPRFYPGTGRFFAYRQRAGIFGHNAPKWDSLPANLRFNTIIKTYKSDGSFDKKEFVEAAYPAPGWENRTLEDDASPSGDQRLVFLDNVYPGIVEDSWILLEAPSGYGEHAEAFQVKSNVETTRRDFAISAKVSRLKVDAGSAFNSNFKMRTTTVFGKSEQLELADVPILDLVEGDTITLDGFYPGLKAGQRVILTGERDDLEGVYASETKILKEVIIEAGFTVITFDKALTHSYIRNTVTINANVARATHGETVTEVLGSGDAAQVFQQFTLRQPPLTYTGASSPGGVESTLEIRVNDLLWTEVSAFYGHGPDEHIYITRLGNDGKTNVIFGDGLSGARLATGQENVTATYRKGIGLEGLVEAGQLTTLMTRPLGVKEVTNPNDASGAADAETVNQARQNAPLTVLTLDRVVSLRDFEDFAHAFAGIEKARADWVWAGETRLVYLTVAGAKGKAVAENSTTYKNLKKAVEGSGNERQPFDIGSYVSLSFYIKGKIRVDPQYIKETVITGVKTTLEEFYSFENRGLAQPVTKSEVLAVIQGVTGVEAVDLDELYLAGETADLYPYLPARKGQWDPQQNPPAPVPAQLLTLAPNGVTISLMEKKQ